MAGKLQNFIATVLLIIPLTLMISNMKVSSSDESKKMKSSHSCVLFNIGDSNSDTGAFCAAYGDCLNNPYGQSLGPHEIMIPRQSDGKIYLDFLCESLKVGFLSPYLESSGSNFHGGVNFAVIGATIQTGRTAFPLGTQTKQFLHFQNRTRQLRGLGKGAMISDQEFSHGIYSVDLGQNDLVFAFNGSSYELITTKFIPEFIKAIENSIKVLHGVGAQKFLVYNTGPLGCLPSYLPLGKPYGKEVDEAGCNAVLNKAAKTFNRALDSLCNMLRSELKEVVIVCTDMYTIKYDLFVNPTKYGFENPLQSCLQRPGPTARPDPSRRVTFDGIHFAQAANAIVAAKIASGGYSLPNITLEDLCNL